MNQNLKVTKKTMIALREEQLRRLKGHIRAGKGTTLKDLVEEAVLAKYSINL